MRTDAITATQFRADRQAAGLPVASKDRIKRAQRIIDGNPMLRDHRTPLGLQLLALEMPLNRRERMANRRSVEDGGLGLTLEPMRVRTGDADEVTASLASSEAFVEANPHLNERDAAEAVALAFGFAGSIDPVIKRAERFANSERQGRVCGHLRTKLIMLSAMAQVIDLVRQREVKAAEAAAELPTKDD